MNTKIITKETAFMKQGFSHGLGFYYLADINILLNYTVSAYVNDVYLQQRLHIDNQFSLGYQFGGESSTMAFAPSLSIGGSRYRFANDNRLAYLHTSGGYTIMLKLGNKNKEFRNWRLIQSSHIGWANEIHWSGQKNQFVNYSIKLGIGYAFR